MNGAVAENLYRRESQQNSSRGKPLQTDTSETLFGVRTRHLDMPDNTSRWGDDSVNARSRAADTEAKAVRAPSTVTQYEDTEPESDSDKGKALAKKIRREEKRLKREKEKKKHKHKKDHISSGRKVHFFLELLPSHDIFIIKFCFFHFPSQCSILQVKYLLLMHPDYHRTFGVLSCKQN